MSALTGTVFTIAVALAVAVISMRQRRAFPEIRERRCAGRQWKRRFPAAPKADIRRFLDSLVDAMGLPYGLRLKFRPDDKVLEIYRSLYGGKTPAADAMECESFVKMLACEFNVSLDSVLSAWHENVTLADLLSATQPVEAMLPNKSLERSRAG